MTNHRKDSLGSLWIRGLGAAAALACALSALAVGCKLISDGFRTEGPLSTFPHDKHAGAGLECEECHKPAEAAGPPALPGREDCLFCHDEETEGAMLARFFAGGEPLWVHAGRQSGEIIFDHGRHVKYAGEGCAACHGDMASSSAIESDAFMTMAECVDCHQREDAAADDCAACHREIRRDTPPVTHAGAWEFQHGLQARQGAFHTADQCELCHTQSSCDHCHTTQRPRSHNQYWRQKGHGLIAGIDRSRCFVCHQRDTCDRCHSRVQPISHTASFGAPFNRHCTSCHLPLNSSDSCVVCHFGTPSHGSAPALPGNTAHMTASPADCRACHAPLPHPDNGQNCRFCHF